MYTHTATLLSLSLSFISLTLVSVLHSFTLFRSQWLQRVIPPPLLSGLINSMILTSVSGYRV